MYIDIGLGYFISNTFIYLIFTSIVPIYFYDNTQCRERDDKIKYQGNGADVVLER